MQAVQVHAQFCTPNVLGGLPIWGDSEVLFCNHGLENKNKIISCAIN